MNREIYMKERDYETYMFIVNYIKRQGYPPTLREIGKGVGLNSIASVSSRLERLETLGKIKVKLGSPRAIQLIGYQFVKTR